MKRSIGYCVLLACATLTASEPAKPWKKLSPAIGGRRWDVPFATANGQLHVLGGRTTWADYKLPRPYDVLTWNASRLEWENDFPEGKSWGPRMGNCRAPAWKDERWGFVDSEGNTRPNWTVYGTFSLGTKYDYDPDTKKFYFYAHGRTFTYDPVARLWAELKTKSNPEQALGGILLWSSMCYDRHNQRFVLFGGGNIQTSRGDPGTWAFSPADGSWTQLSVDQQPSPRANSRLSYDPLTKKIVLFGGDRLDQLFADTWTFDCVSNRWEQKKAELGPRPRAGHALMPLGEGRMLLLGGYGYGSSTEYVASLYRRLPFEAWIYDVPANRWSLVGYWEAKDSPAGPMNASWNATVLDDAVFVLADGLWTWPLSSVRLEDETRKFGVAVGVVERRTGSYDPEWYRDVPPTEPERVADELKALTANRWVVRSTPKRPGMNMDWGSAIFLPERDQIVRFSGGHSAYSGTAPQVYDVKTDRYSIPFAPELPIEFVYSNDQVLGEWSFKGNPWMTGHTYKSTGYDPLSQQFVFAPHDFTYFFDTRIGKWSRSPEKNPYRADFYNVTVCSTPQGAVVWGDRREGGGAGLWRLDAQRKWNALTLKGTLPAKSPDQHGLAYDSKRDRLLFFSGIDKKRGDVTAYDLKTGHASWLDPAGKFSAGVHSRETIYLPEEDMVLIGARVPVGDAWHWLAYDCEHNAWKTIDLGGEDPIGKAGKEFNNSMGLMYDPGRKLVWAVGQYSHVHVLRLDGERALAIGDRK